MSASTAIARKQSRAVNNNYYNPITNHLLMELYNATNGAQWIRNENWGDNSVSVCSWFGILCSGDGLAININLAANNLVGEIPSSLGSLMDLESLRLDNNQLTGSIPSSLWFPYQKTSVPSTQQQPTHLNLHRFLDDTVAAV